MLLSNTAGIYLGDERWEPVYEELARRGAYAFVHPSLPAHALPLGDEHPMWLYEFPYDTTRALAKLIFSGTFERHPSIRFQFAHLGGVAPFLAHRIASLSDREPERTRLAPAGAVVPNRQYYDTGLSANTPPRSPPRSRSRRSSTSCSAPIGRTPRSRRAETTPLRSSMSSAALNAWLLNRAMPQHWSRA